MRILFRFLLPAFAAAFIAAPISCSMELQPSANRHRAMVRLLRDIERNTSARDNIFDSKAQLRRIDSVLSHTDTDAAMRIHRYRKAMILLELGEELKAARILEGLVSERPDDLRSMKALALAHLRMGERSNCVMHHASASCILPIAGPGIHTDPAGSSNAIALYQNILRRDPQDLSSRWLLNIAYMTIGKYPGSVPPSYLIRDLDEASQHRIAPFEDIAGDLHLDVNSMSGGSIADDFDNDGYIDILTSGWGDRDQLRFFRNRGDGSFEDLSATAGLVGITGGLNMMQTDYNNDGLKDIFVLRGAWRGEFGLIPNSLLRNNGDGTFTDVTIDSGLLSFHPTQTATWNDFNNDGWLDVFIGNETTSDDNDKQHRCELFINNQDGTFTDMAASASCDFAQFVKGVTSGDYNNDGWQDIFISSVDGKRKLLKNKGIIDGRIDFEDVTESSGVGNDQAKTFPTWFWDYDNDGWLDIFACDYSFDESLAFDVASEKLGSDDPAKNKMLLYHNNGDGTFTNVAREAGLNTYAFAMGSNFGDINNDGYLDMYLGTGNPLYESLIPNRMFLNLKGRSFADVTTSARVGHLQKGHGISFADIDNDGDQDIYTHIGGAYPGDAYRNSFFLNPGQGHNRWIAVSLEGRESNRVAIGARIKLTFREKGRVRSVYRDVNTGGSFGASPLRSEIGIGEATIIDEMEIHWPASKLVQIFHNVHPNQFIRIIEGDDKITQENLLRIQWSLPNRLCVQ